MSAIEKTSLEAHVELCGERYTRLEDKLDDVVRRIERSYVRFDKMEQSVNVIKEFATNHHTDRFKSIDQNIPIIVVENSNNQKFKDALESKYKNLKCVLSKSNLGMGAANNIGIKLTKTDYVFILNPDVNLHPNTLSELYLASEKLSEFSIISPISSILKLELI